MGSRAALLVIDVQRVYMEPEPMVTSDGDDLINKCNGLIGRARGAGIPVLFVRHRSDDQPDDPALVAVHPDLGALDSEPVIEKRFGSAFFRTDLEQTLADLDVRTLYVCGLATYGCVNATVLCAVCRDYETMVVKDAHGSQSYPGEPAEGIIARFNATWESAGATLVRANDVPF